MSCRRAHTNSKIKLRPPGPPLMVCSLGFIYDKENQQDSSLLCLKIVFDKQPDDSTVCDLKNSLNLCLNYCLLTSQLEVQYEKRSQ